MSEGTVSHLLEGISWKLDMTWVGRTYNNEREIYLHAVSSSDTVLDRLVGKRAVPPHDRSSK